MFLNRRGTLSPCYYPLIQINGQPNRAIKVALTATKISQLALVNVDWRLRAFWAACSWQHCILR